MASTFANPAAAAPLDIVQERRPAIKAGLKNLQKATKWQHDGNAMAVACALSRLTRKEVAARLGVGENQLAAWVAGVERPQTERFEDDAVLAAPMATAKALQRPDVFEVQWVITAKVTR